MFKRANVASFSELTLRLSGMRITELYEIICRGDEAELSLYWPRYENHEEKNELQKRVTVSTAEIIELLNKCRVISWDGFYGKNPPGLLDGTMFRFNATINDGRRISASGSNNYPRHYRDFTDALYEMLDRQ